MKPNRTYQEALALVKADLIYEDREVATAEPLARSEYRAWDVSFKEGFSFLVHDEYEKAPAPEPGSVLRLFGEGFGRPIRGVGPLVRTGRRTRNTPIAHLYSYRTADEEKREHEEWVASEKQKKRASWEAKKAETARDVAALPAPFRERFEFFMRRAEWGPEFGPYELFVMQEAVKIAGVEWEGLRGVEAVSAFAKLGYAAQKQLLPSLGEDHSGNTFGAACALARYYLTQPELVPKMHGALCPLVGCAEYGCWATTQKEPLP